MYSSRKSLSSSLLKGPGRSIGFSPDPLPLNGIGNWWILRKNCGGALYKRFILGRRWGQLGELLAFLFIIFRNGGRCSFEAGCALTRYIVRLWHVTLWFFKRMGDHGPWGVFVGITSLENGIFLLEGPGCTRRTSSMITSQLLCIYVVQRLFSYRERLQNQRKRWSLQFENSSYDELETSIGDHWQWVERFYFFVAHPDQEQLQDSGDDSLWLQVECWVKENWCDVD